LKINLYIHPENDDYFLSFGRHSKHENYSRKSSIFYFDGEEYLIGFSCNWKRLRKIL